MGDALSPSDLALLQSALRQVSEARATMEFVSRHIAVQYRLDHTSLLNQETGEITRQAVSVAPDPVAAK